MAVHFFLVSLLLINSVVASSELWSQTYGGADIDHVEAIIQTHDEGFALVGYTDSFGAGYSDFWLVKTDESGNMAWNRTYGGVDFDIAYSLVETLDMGYVIVGETSSFGAGASDFWVIKVDGLGNVLWNKTYGGTGFEGATSIIQTSDGGFAIAGNIGFQSVDFQMFDFWLVKTDSYGNLEWNQTYGQADRDFVHSLVETSDGGFALAGSSGASFSAGPADFWLVKTDLNGNMEWNVTFGGADFESAYSLIELSDEGFVLAGYTCSFGAGGADALLVKTDNFGNVVWNKTYGGTSDDRAHSLVEVSDGGFAMAGRTLSFGDNCDFWLIRTAADGTVHWNQTYGGADFDVAYSLVQTSDMGFALAGETKSFGAGSIDYCLIKTNEQGITEFSSLIILPLLLVASFAAIICKYKLSKENPRKKN